MSAQTESEILARLECLSMTERLGIVESLAHQVREDLQLSAGQSAQDVGEELARAAKALRADYLEDKDSTALTALESEPFYA
jgi:hypothetical protein